jgi:hypothetical protein
MSDDRDFQVLESYLGSVPAVVLPFGHGRGPDGRWWVKFAIEINNPLAWHVVQELGYVLNYLSLEERLPTTFKPVSPPPYLNGGPREFLSWVIECSDAAFEPGTVAEWLEGRLPQPVDDPDQWAKDDGA